MNQNLEIEGKYPIAETFYSIIGEGEFTGQAAFFIRLAGCNLNCDFCDTNYLEEYQASPEDLFKEAIKFPSRKVVITGGEPCIHKLKPLTNIFRKEFKIHLETNGTLSSDSLDFDWVAVSPKNEQVSNFWLAYASEVKFLCGFEGWKELLEKLLPKANGIKWLMPIANGPTLDPRTTSWAVEYCLKHPKIKFCCQVHKVIGVK